MQVWWSWAYSTQRTKLSPCIVCRSMSPPPNYCDLVHLGPLRGNHIFLWPKSNVFRHTLTYSTGSRTDGKQNQCIELRINALSWESMNWFCTELICKPMHWWGEINALIVGILDCENQWIDSQNQWFGYEINDLIWKSMNWFWESMIWFFGVNELILPINSFFGKYLNWVACCENEWVGSGSQWFDSEINELIVRTNELILKINALLLKSIHWEENCCVYCENQWIDSYT